MTAESRKNNTAEGSGQVGPQKLSECTPDHSAD